MNKLPMLAGALLALAVPAHAADDPIAVRQALMSSNGASAGMAGAVLKGELPYNPAIGKAVLVSLNATAMAFGDYFPEGSGDDPRTEAAPKIWQDMADFRAKLDEFQAKTSAAVQAAGKEGPADAEAFKAAVQPVLGTCKDCHESYRIDD